jgi:hypothetical protein
MRSHQCHGPLSGERKGTGWRCLATIRQGRWNRTHVNTVCMIGRSHRVSPHPSSAYETPVSPPGFLRFSAALRRRPYSYRGSPNGNNRADFRHSGTGVSGPYRSAISAGEAICDGSVRSFAAGSALVPPSEMAASPPLARRAGAARNDAVAGST